MDIDTRTRITADRGRGGELLDLVARAVVEG